ncbi:MAG TPA: TIM44-like domain-containing protein [Solirubrobacteraceae bacterium]|nr:TIM44-like domain-containing protein [Solirubrobacteraceae bacterium]
MSPRRRRALFILLAAGALALLLAPDALASAGGGSSGFSDGGGGGGGHSGFALYLIFDLLIHIAVLGHGLGALVLLGVGLAYLFVTRVMPRMSDDWQARAAKRGPRRSRRGPSQRERRVELAAAEAAESDPVWASDEVRAAAGKLFMDIQLAWDADDRARLHALVGPDLMHEWELRLDDFDRRGWRNHVQVLGEPSVELVGLTHRGDPETDRVVVRIDARMKDYVIDRFGRHLKRNGRLGETTRVREFWSLGHSGGHWKLISIEENREGAHALDEQIVATPWADDRGLRDAALVEGAVADAAPAGTSPGELASVSYEGNAQAAANDLSLADGRFSPDILEVAARRAVQAWAEAIDGPDAALDAIATTRAKRELLYAGDTSGSLRMVVRGPVVKRIRIVGLDAAAEPPTMTIEVDLTGRRYLENRDTAGVVAGSRTRTQSFTERWTLSLTGDERQPWRITAASAPVGLA